MVESARVRALARFATAQTTEDVVSIALEEVPEISSVHTVGVHLDGGSPEIRLTGAPVRALLQYSSLPPGSDPLLTYAQATRCPVHELVLLTPEEWHRLPLYEYVAGPFGFEHYLVAPLLGRGQIIGALTLARRTGTSAFTQRDLTEAAVITAHMSVALAHSSRCESSAATLLSRLTPREASIASLVAKGLDNTEIAEQLEISENTVKKHLKATFAKLDVSRRAELASLVTLGGLA